MKPSKWSNTVKLLWKWYIYIIGNNFFRLKYIYALYRVDKDHVRMYVFAYLFTNFIYLLHFFNVLGMYLWNCFVMNLHL